MHAISDGLDDMIVDESARIAVITFDDSMHFYDLGVRTGLTAIFSPPPSLTILGCTNQRLPTCAVDPKVQLWAPPPALMCASSGLCMVVDPPLYPPLPPFTPHLTPP